MPIPDLPVLPPTEGSHLTRKFGRETANYSSGSPLNRLSFLRGDRDFLRAAFAHPAARFLLLRGLAPLVPAADPARLAFAARADVAPLTGEDPFARSEEEMVAEYDSSEERAVVVFLGIDERGEVAVGQDGEGEVQGERERFRYRDFEGAPYFAVDVTPRGKLADAAEALSKVMEERGLKFYDHSPRHMGLVAGQGEYIAAHTRPQVYSSKE
jgi:NAD+ diphosphatase